MIAANATPAAGAPGALHIAAPNPWYREPWPWLLMAGPAIVVVAGFLTLGFAVQSADGLVADDYYKQGKAINMTLARDARARVLGYAALLATTGDGRIVLSFAEASPDTTRLRLALHHPTRAGGDREVWLQRTAPGVYTAAAADFAGSRWGLTLDDDSRSWRLTASWSAGAAAASFDSAKYPG